MMRAMLTTSDNPHDPFLEFREWYAFDCQNGYYSSSLLARLTLTSDELSEWEQQQRNEIAIDEIVSENISGMFIKVTKEFPEED